MAFFAVNAQKVSPRSKRVWDGYTFYKPRVGISMRLFTYDGAWLETSPIERILWCGDSAYLKTHNSTYRITLRPGPPEALTALFSGSLPADASHA